jgi:hypothetical protein
MQIEWLKRWNFQPIDANGRPIKTDAPKENTDKEKKDAEIAERLLEIPDVEI